MPKRGAARGPGTRARPGTGALLWPAHRPEQV